ncbi:hypothetical protein [Halocynthiibacter namhaensis]|uniref:hypothetical protein n=1 Tax=Halocynthiibacter namhaensis TaxID=1290553 RepID=UPI00057913CB|nr:hypothetical protein [Halocynthiibacter namhaensis]
MSDVPIFLLLVFIPGILMVVGYVWWNWPEKNGPKAPRGTAPGQGDTLVEGGGGGSRGGVSTVTRVSKDPQQYAREMMPRGKK